MRLPKTRLNSGYIPGIALTLSMFLAGNAGAVADAFLVDAGEQRAFPVVIDPGFNGTANVRLKFEDGNPLQYVIINESWCRSVGRSICTFYMWHEGAHVVMNHPLNRTPLHLAEPEADCWAAKHAPSEAVRSAYAWFMAGAEVPRVHGTSQKRAERIGACAGF